MTGICVMGRAKDRGDSSKLESSESPDTPLQPHRPGDEMGPWSRTGMRWDHGPGKEITVRDRMGTEPGK